MSGAQAWIMDVVLLSGSTRSVQEGRMYVCITMYEETWTSIGRNVPRECQIHLSITTLKKCCLRNKM